MIKRLLKLPIYTICILSWLIVYSAYCIISLVIIFLIFFGYCIIFGKKPDAIELWVKSIVWASEIPEKLITWWLK
jgi:hypothetical protein